MLRDRDVQASSAFVLMCLLALAMGGCSALLGDFDVVAGTDASFPDGATDASVPDGATGDAARSDASDGGTTTTDGGCAKSTCGADCVDTATDPKNCGA